MVIRAAQHLFGSLGSEPSASQRGGPHNFAYTRNLLTAREVAELEGRLFYRAAPSAAPVKLAFFQLTSGKVIISRAVPLEGTDRFGRRGLYLAHSLVFTPEDFSRLRNDPFMVLEHLKEQLASTAQHVLDAVKADGDLAPLSFDVPESRVAAVEAELLEAAKAWDPQELLKLAALAVNAPELGAERRSVAVVGPPEQVLQALRAAFSLLPEVLRPSCTFDSHAYGSNPAAGYFWARGYPSASDGPLLALVVDTLGRKVKTSLPWSPSPYEKWMAGGLSRHAEGEVLAHKSAAWALSCSLLGQGGASEAALQAPPELLGAFLDANGPLVAERLRASLAALLGPDLAARLQEAVAARLRRQGPEALYKAMVKGVVAASDLEGELLELLSRRPSPQELAAVGRALRSVPIPPAGPAALVAFWEGRHSSLAGELDRVVDEARYRALLRLLMREHGVSPAWLVSAKRAQVVAGEFARLCGETPERQAQLPEVARALLGVSRPDALEALAPLIPRCDRACLAALDRSLGLQRDVLPPRFAAALGDGLGGAQGLKPLSMSEWTKSLRQELKGRDD